MSTEMDRVLSEQQEARDYIVERRGADAEGAWRGLEDWVLEELMLAYPERWQHNTSSRLQREDRAGTDSELPLP